MTNKNVSKKLKNQKFLVSAGINNVLPEGVTDDTAVLLRNVSKTYRVFKNKTDIFLNVFFPKQHRVVKALQKINLHVKKGEVVGLIGYNGSGKTTLLKVISRIITPDKNSEVYVNGSIGTMIALGTGFIKELTGRENIYYRAEIMGIPKEQIEKNIEAIIEYSDLEERIDDPIETYSSGMKARLGFSYYSFINPDIMIVDEVTAVGDIKFKAKARKTITDMFKSGKTIFFVSHNMDEIVSYCTRAIVLRKGKIVDEGVPATLVANYKAGMYLTKKAIEKRKRQMEKLEELKISEEYKDIRLNDLLDNDAAMQGIENEEFFMRPDAEQTSDEATAKVTFNSLSGKADNEE